MNFQLRPHLTTAERRLPFECVTLLLQGGGALGAYQGGVYEALAEASASSAAGPVTCGAGARSAGGGGGA